MKIVTDVRTMGSKPSGVGIYAFNYLKELIDTEHELILLTDVEISEEMQYMRGHGVSIISYGKIVYRSAQVFQYFKFVKQQLEHLQPELFWEPNILIPGSLGDFKGKVMITIHDMFPVTHMQYFGWKYALYFRYMLHRTAKKTDIVLYNSLETKAESEHYFPELKKKRDFVQYVIVPRIEAGAESESCAVADEAQGKEYFLYVGNMEKRKGVDLLLEAYDQYRQKGGRMNLIMAGKSREKDIDEKVAALIKKYEEVEYRGYVGDEEKQWLYQNCACFLFPSMAEGFGICVLEAMNYYKPIIASELSIFREIVGDDINYFSLEGDWKQKADHLVESLFCYNTEVDQKRYDQVLERYTVKTLRESMIEVLRVCGSEME